ncbi:unnamed protein product [Urochloa decumbens]|uniref:HTH myb-type domain-containing protein n=1 Tax=Urochloa decumbens TaxID=240449 RepID=A0ABC9A115_9POAL
MPHDGSAAAPPPPEPEPEPEPTWTRRDDKFLELLLFTRNTVSFHVASEIIGKTPDQMQQRCSFMFSELRRVLEALEVETPPEWDKEIIVAAPATAAPAAGEEEVPLAVGVPAAPPVAARVDSAAPTTVVGGGGVRRRKKTAEQWTEKEHRRFLAGLDRYIGRWKAMSRECLPSKTASQIASHYQKFRNREKQRERDECKRKSIHDITEPAGIAATFAVSGGEAAAWEDVESGEDGLGPVEEFPGADDLGTLLT